MPIVYVVITRGNAPMKGVDVTATILLTGASGVMGTALRPRLLAAGHRLRLVCRREPADGTRPGEELILADVTDRDAMRHASNGVDLIVHLGGVAQESDWERILHTNVHGTQVILETARENGVRRVLLASSCHAVGFTPASEGADAPVLLPRPDSFYGVSKVAIEALGSLYADHAGMSIVTARIGTAYPTPNSLRMLATWLSADDSTRLVEAALGLDEPGHHVVWGVSANSAAWFDLSAGHSIGYFPQDNASAAAPELVAELAGQGLDPGSPGADMLLGGGIASADVPLGKAW